MDLGWFGNLVDKVGVPLAVAFLTGWAVIKWVAPRMAMERAAAKFVEAVEAAQKAAAKQRDIELTAHFVQLLRDLERKIETENKTTRKSMRNVLMVMMLDIEVWIQGKGFPRRALEEENDE